MAKFKNSFALLDDEEGDDVAVLVDRIVKKVDDSLLHAPNQKDSLEFVQDGSGSRRGGQGHRGGSCENAYGVSDDIQDDSVQNKYGKNYSRDSYGHGDVNEDYEHSGVDRWEYVNKAAEGYNYQSGRRRGYRVEVQYNDAMDAQRRYRNGNWSSDGWRKVHGDQAQSDVAADGHGRYRNGNGSYDGERRGNGDRVQDNHTADGQRRFRTGNESHGNRRGDGGQTHNNDAYGDGNENRTNDGKRRYRDRSQSYVGKRRGHGDQTPNNVAVDGPGKYRNENWSYDGERKGTKYQVQNNDAGYGQDRYRNGRQSYGVDRKYYENQVQENNIGSGLLNVKGGVNEDKLDNEFRGEERTNRNGNRNYDGGRRSYNGYRGNGRQEYQRPEAGEVEETGNGGYRGKGRRDYGRIGSVEGEDTGNVAGGLDVKADCVNNNGSDAALYGDINFPKEADEQKSQEESELKKKQFEESQQKKEEEDKEAKLMTLAEYEKLLLEKKQLLESRKTRERIVAIDKDLEGMRLVKKQDDPDDKLKSEEKLQKKGSVEKKEKGRKVVVHEFFKPAFHRRSNGRGGHGHGDQAGQTNGNASRARTQHRGLLAVPTDRDFPVLSASAASAVKS